MNYDSVILGENAKFTTDCNETQINNNVLVCGSSGSGKTMSITEPKLLYTNNASLIVTLSKRRLVSDYSELFRQRNYNVWDLNFVSPNESGAAYDPLQYVKNWSDVKELSTAIVMADSRKKDSTADPYWDLAGIRLLSALISFVLMTNRKGTMADVVGLFKTLQISSCEGGIKTTLDDAFEKIRKIDRKHFVISCWDTFRNTPIKTAGCIYSTLAAMINTVFTPELCDMMKKAQKIDFKKLSSVKTILFVTTSAVNPSLNIFANIFYSQMFKELFEIGEKNKNGRLDIPVHVICDDFACGAKILNFEEYISIFREKGIAVTMMLQSESQLESIYGEAQATTIINNSDTYIYLGGMDLYTARSVSERLNIPVEEVLYMPIGKEYIFRRGQKPMITKRYDIQNDKEYKKLLDLKKEREELDKETALFFEKLYIDGRR